MDWTGIPFFLAAVRAGTLRGAAEATGATHATVKRHIEVLEHSYGVQLFRRTRRGLELTAAGRDLLPVVEAAEVKVNEARKRVQGLDKEETGVVRFSTTGTLVYEIVAPILARFSKAYPDIDLEIRVSDRFEDINKLQTDVSLRFAQDVQDDVIARKLFPLALVPMASRTYLETHLPIAGPSGEGLHWIGWDSADRHPDWVADSAFPAAEARHATTDPVLQLSLARQGVGMINSSVYFTTIYPELVPVPGTTPVLDRNLWLLFHSELRRTVRVRRFIDFLSRELIALKPLLQAGA
ncbi:LysR family transcriptional regulator [Cognatishimia sp.]|uniref:LysR family transcriptional regulator n=1 Tax=Cognatishimia sp. TaxID=2211648 RepID=UPI003512D1D6